MKGLEIDDGGSVQCYECTKCHWNVHLKIVTVVNDMLHIYIPPNKR